VVVSLNSRPTVWNLSARYDLRNPVIVFSEDFRRDLNTHLFTGHYGALTHYRRLRHRPLQIYVYLLEPVAGIPLTNVTRGLQY